jgi:hypothetical protein
MELYLNSTWTERCGNSSYVAEAIAWSENGNHATIYATAPLLIKQTPNS